MRFPIKPILGMTLAFVGIFEELVFAEDATVKPEPGPNAVGVADPPKAKPAVEVLNLDEVKKPRRVIGQNVIRLGRPQNVAAAQMKEAVIAQKIQIFRPIIDEELRLIRSVCEDMPMELRVKLKEAIEQGVVTAIQGEPSPTATRVTSSVRQIIFDTMKDKVYEEYLPKYVEASTNRTAHRKQAAILNVVSQLDSQLLLTKEQRDKIENSVSTKWNDAWDQWLFQREYFPLEISPLVVPHLTTDQADVWAQLQLERTGIQVPQFQQVFVRDDDWWVPVPKN